MKIKVGIRWFERQTVKRLLFIFLPLYLFVSLQNSFSADSKVVDQLIRSSVNAVLNILRDKGLKKETKKERVMSVVNKVFDMPLMAKLVLGRKYWPKFSEKEKKEFTDLFVKSLQDSYFDKMDNLTDEYVEFDPPVRKDDKFSMASYINSKGKRYEICYKLYRKKDSSAESADSWKVYDVEIEEISFVKSYSAQYDQFLQTNSVRQLLDTMREKSLDIPKELKAKDKTNNVQESGDNTHP